LTGWFDNHLVRPGSFVRPWKQQGIGSAALGQGGFTLPFVLVMIAISLIAISSVTLLATHFRSISSAEDGERLYYAMDAGIEAAMADLIRGADLLDPAYSPPEIDVNGVKTTVTVDSLGESANLDPILQYFDPGLRDPALLMISSGQRYLLHIMNVHPGTLQVNWAFDIIKNNEELLEGNLILKVLKLDALPSSGGGSGCPSGALHALINKEITSAGAYTMSSGAIDIIEPGIYSVAFCVENLAGATLTTRPYKPSGSLTDTWIYAMAYKDYKITAHAQVATVTAFVRQMPGPTQPPVGGWSRTNISWITNRVTPYQWVR
jgi:hypothetical protein